MSKTLEKTGFDEEREIYMRKMNKKTNQKKYLKQNQSQVRKQQEEAITLIALVITIIVLLILAGVTIATLTG